MKAKKLFREAYSLQRKAMKQGKYFHNYFPCEILDGGIPSRMLCPSWAEEVEMMAAARSVCRSRFLGR